MNLNFKTFGQGPPLIILHGLFGTLDNWQTLAKRWAEHYSVYLLDLRNHGKSPHADEMNYTIMAEDVRLFMESQWIYEAIVLGHSMGGKVAMELALHHPDMVRQLLVVDIAPKSYPGGHEGIFAALLALDLSQINDRKEAEVQLREHIPEQGVRQFLLKNLSREKEGGYRWKMNLPIIHQFYQEILGNVYQEGQYEGPTLFIRGGQSRYIADEDMDVIHQLFPAATLKTVPQAGHWVHAEAPDDLHAFVLAFLEEEN